jgi:hypothetical protein
MTMRLANPTPADLRDELTEVAECAWNGWPNVGGIAGQMLVEQVAEWRGIRTWL